MRSVVAALVACMALVAVATAAPAFSFKEFLKHEWAEFKEEFDHLKCPGCHFVLTEVKKELGDAKVDAAIVSALDKVCGAIPDGLGPICEELVDVAAPKVIAWVDGKIDPDALCTTVKACPATEAVFVEDSLPCFLCTHAMQWVEDKIASNSTEAKVEEELEKLCTSHIVPHKYQATCEALVESYLPELVNAFNNKLPPKQICAIMTLCQKQMTPFVEPTAADSLPCLGCKFAFTKLEEALGANRTQTLIEEELEKVCHYLPTKSMRDMCAPLVEAYFPKIVEMIVNKEPPTKICAQITLCHKKTFAALEAMALKEKFKCKACKYTLTKVIEDLNGEPLTPANVEKALDEVCDQLPDVMSFVCESIVDMYSDEISEFVMQKMQPAQICQQIHFC